jgi:hypothetical protein
MTLGAWTRLGFEIATLLTALAALASAGLTYSQLQLSTDATRLAAYQQTIANSIEFDKAMADRPNLRPYFKEGKPIAKDNGDYNEAALIAELQLDIIDSIIAYPILFAKQSETSTWDVTYHRAFRESPIMCEFLQERREQYHEQTVQIAKKVCLVTKPW